MVAPSRSICADDPRDQLAETLRAPPPFLIMQNWTSLVPRPSQKTKTGRWQRSANKAAAYGDHKPAGGENGLK